MLKRLAFMARSHKSGVGGVGGGLITCVGRRWWQSLDRFLPKSLNNKDWKTRCLNDALLMYVQTM